MAALPYTRAEHRTSLQHKTWEKVTDATTLDYYIDKAELEVIASWIAFDKGLQARVRQSAATDSSGILLVPKGFSKLLRLEDSDKAKYAFIDNMDNVWNVNGYFFAGFDATNNKRQIQVYANGAVLASTTLYWWDITIVQMGSGSTTESCIPYGYKELIDYKAAQKYWEDQGSSMKKESREWEQKFNGLLASAKEFFGHPTEDPEFVENYDSHAGEGGPSFSHIAS